MTAFLIAPFPGNKHPASSYFTRGTGHDEQARYTEECTVFLRNMDRLKKKYETARSYVPAPVFIPHMVRPLASSVLVQRKLPSSKRMHQLETQHGIQADFLRIRALPFTQEVTDFVDKYDQVFVVEMNRDGQMNQILTIEYPQKARTSNLWRLGMACQPPPGGCAKAFLPGTSPCESNGGSNRQSST